MPRMLTRAALAVAAATTLTLSVSATQASAITDVSCNQTDFLKINYSFNFHPASTCFANAGTITNLRLANAWTLSSGNNAGYVAGEGAATYFGFDKWQNVVFPRPDQGASFQVDTVHIN